MIQLFDVTYISELSAFIAAIFFLHKKSTGWQLFVFYMLFVVVVETLGWYLPAVLGKEENDWLYNIYLLAETPFYIYVLSKAPQLSNKKKQLLVLLLLFVSSYIVEVLFVNNIFTYGENTQVLGNIIISFITCYFFYSILISEDAVDLLKYEYFWVSIGLLFYSIGTTILFLFLPSLRAYYQETCIRLYQYIMNEFNFLLYGSLIVAFVCRRKKLK
jgi:hypothetical protein